MALIFFLSSGVCDRNHRRVGKRRSVPGRIGASVHFQLFHISRQSEEIQRYKSVAGRWNVCHFLQSGSRETEAICTQFMFIDYLVIPLMNTNQLSWKFFLQHDCIERDQCHVNEVIWNWFLFAISGSWCLRR